MVRLLTKKTLIAVAIFVILITLFTLAIDISHAATKTQLINAQNEYDKICDMQNREIGKTIVSRKDGSTISINDVLKNATYDGTPYEPPISVSVCLNSRSMVVLKEGVDYSVSYINNVNAGTAIIRITGTGDYYGTVDIPFEIKPCTWITFWYDKGGSLDEVVEGNIDSEKRQRLCVGESGSLLERIYTGSEIQISNIYATTLYSKHSFSLSGDLFPPSDRGFSNNSGNGTLFIGDEIEGVLRNGKDYTIKYENNVGPGTARIIFQGVGNYKGVWKTESFSIKEEKRESKPTSSPAQKRDVSKCTVSLKKKNLFKNGGVKPRVDLKYKGANLTLGKDYSIVYKNYKTIGTARVIITGKGSYKGTVKKNYYIVPDGIKVSNTKNWLEAGKTRINIKIKSVYKKYTYIQVCQSNSKFFKKSKTTNIPRSKVKNRTLKMRAGFKKGKRYYIKVRAIKKVGSHSYAGPWSKSIVVKGR